MRTLLPALALLAAPGFAQSGNLAEIPVFLTATGSVDDSEILHVNAAGSPATPVHEQDIRYLRTNMFGPGSGLKVQAFSRGVSLFQIKWSTSLQKWYYDTASTQWTFMVFGVTPGTSGQENSNVYPPNAEKHIYAYQNGDDLPDSVRDKVTVVRDGDEMQTTTIRGIDSYASGGLLGPDVDADGDIQIFLTLDPGSIAGTGLSTATIYTMTCTDSNWSALTPYKTNVDLGIGATDVIDALSVDAESGNIIFSIVTAEQSKELMLYKWDNVANDREYVGPLWAVSGNLFVVDKLDLGPGDGIAGACNDDPPLFDGNVLPPSSNGYERARTTALMLKTQPAEVSSAVSFSVHRIYKLVGNGRADFYQLNLSLVGLPFTGSSLQPYTVRFQTKTDHGWETFKTKQLSASIGARTSATIEVQLAGPEVNGMNFVGEIVPFRCFLFDSNDNSVQTHRMGCWR